MRMIQHRVFSYYTFVRVFSVLHMHEHPAVVWHYYTARIPSACKLFHLDTFAWCFEMRLSTVFLIFFTRSLLTSLYLFLRLFEL